MSGHGLTLGQVVQRLHQIHNDLDAAADDVKAARDDEVRAVEAYRVAKARASLSGDCPVPKRGENGVTVAQRDAWVDERCTEQRNMARGCEAIRASAEDRLRVTRDQASVVQTLAGVMRAEMQLAGSQPGA